MEKPGLLKNIQNRKRVSENSYEILVIFKLKACLFFTPP